MSTLPDSGKEFSKKDLIWVCPWTIFLSWTCLMTIWTPAHFEPSQYFHSLATGRSTSLSYLWIYQYHLLCLILVLEETFPIKPFQILQSSSIAEGPLYKNHFVCTFVCYFYVLLFQFYHISFNMRKLELWTALRVTSTTEIYREA